MIFDNFYVQLLIEKNQSKLQRANFTGAFI